MKPKIFIIGAGNVGSHSAAAIARAQLGTIYLFDAIEDLPIGKALDINQAALSFNTDSKVIGTNSIEDCIDSNIIIFTAGAPRKTGMKRRDLLSENLETIKKLGDSIQTYAPNAQILIVSNPVDVLTWYLKNKFPELNIFGLGCSLDTIRFKYFLAEAFETSVDAANGIVIGAHNDTMMPLINHATVGGVLATHLLPMEKINGVINKTKSAGNVIVSKMKSGGSFFAAARSIAEITESIVRNKQKIFSLSVYCNGEYGYNSIALSLPVLLGESGIMKIIDIDLNKEEQKLLAISAESMHEGIGSIDM